MSSVLFPFWVWLLIVLIIILIVLWFLFRPSGETESAGSDSHSGGDAVHDDAEAFYIIKIDEGTEPPYITNKGKIYERLSSGSFQIKDSNKVLRSEERRVGKECRSRWSPYH